jgi:hypothetical protein
MPEATNLPPNTAAVHPTGRRVLFDLGSSAQDQVAPLASPHSSRPRTTPRPNTLCDAPERAIEGHSFVRLDLLANAAVGWKTASPALLALSGRNVPLGELTEVCQRIAIRASN